MSVEASSPPMTPYAERASVVRPPVAAERSMRKRNVVPPNVSNGEAGSGVSNAGCSVPMSYTAAV